MAAASKTEDTRTPEEIEATVAKLKGEAKAAEAAAKKANAEARKAVADAEQAEINARKAHRSEQDDLASDRFHHVYIFDKDVSEQSVKSCIQQLTQWERQASEPLTVELVINSPGGSIFDGFALIDYIEGLHSRSHTVNTTAYGMAASMAGVLLEVGKTRAMGRNAMLLIHEAQFGAVGSFGQIEDRVKLVEMMHEQILDLFVGRAQPINSKTTRAFIKRNWQRKDWWIPAPEALKLGFCDEIR